jgi:hypothetical protein
MPADPSPLPEAERLCLACALCCNGALFRDVELQAADDPARLRALGLGLRESRGGPRLPQPCPALAGCRCTVYPDRPARCRQFDCALLQALAAGQVNLEQALRRVRRTRRLVARVLKLLHALGDTNEDRPLRQRCLRVLRQQEQAPALDAAASLSDLTLTWHRLNTELAQVFHPGGTVNAG